jgi:ABC-type sugar transport system permease subunit
MEQLDMVVALIRVIGFFSGSVGILFLGVTMLRRAETITRGRRVATRALVYVVAGLYLVAVLAFVIRPELGAVPAVAAVVSSIALGTILMGGFRLSLGERDLAILFVLPAFLGILILYYYPIAQTIIYSLHDLRYTARWLEEAFIGVQNYTHVLTSSNFLQAAGFTFYFTVMAVFFEFWIGLGMAMTTFWVSRHLRGILRSIIVIPWAIPPIISASMWRWLFNSDVGIGALMVQLGLIEQSPLFLVDRTLAVHSVILADVWKWSSVMAIFLLGGLAVISEDIYDAAKVDGARGFFRFRRITLPMIMPTIIVAVLFRAMEALRTFDLVFGLTGGGPGTTTETLSSFAYKYYFKYANFGLGSAYAVVITIVILILSVLYVSRIRKNLRFGG